VIVVTVVSAYFLDGRLFGSLAAGDGRWAAVFLANFHFASLAGSRLGTRPLSPLGNFWSLSVEAQFYLVFPTLFLAAWVRGARGRPRTSLAFVLGLVAAGSFMLCVLQTHQLAGTAYFSPFARAWELSIGALVALDTVHLERLGPRVAAAMTWAGMAAIVASALLFTAATVYPGAFAAIPVLGAALVIAGGCANPAAGCERVL
jgi:peptidoglycan/LPS O-acetylase OafA/YrhL